MSAPLREPLIFDYSRSGLFDRAESLFLELLAFGSYEVQALRHLVEMLQEGESPREFLESLKTDLEQDEVFVFTPKGKVVTLPVGSTTVDFAYAVHTQVGHACIGAKVNGRLVPLHPRRLLR